ncbi:hypothetical protein [Aquabacter spiritensis]|uniref:Uncharacterized protein n=1 Tax=Aquabacter spiritensis TaxID=933073 RepID=A0A4R3LSP9_9HYPH|nr:hypothetical protein [Aquabacter spiritensis]TCT02866.1 hypothetical protein EDC64_11138 [Aquabacter spiritensis]
MKEGPQPYEEADVGEFAAYVAALTSELSRLARDHRLITLAYLLEMVRLEARGVAAEDAAIRPHEP